MPASSSPTATTTTPQPVPHAVSTEEVKEWAHAEGLLFVEASATLGANVERAFGWASQDILDKIKPGVFYDDHIPQHVTRIKMRLSMYLVLEYICDIHVEPGVRCIQACDSGELMTK
jgi:Ras family